MELRWVTSLAADDCGLRSIYRWVVSYPGIVILLIRIFMGTPCGSDVKYSELDILEKRSCSYSQEQKWLDFVHTYNDH